MPLTRRALLQALAAAGGAALARPARAATAPRNLVVVFAEGGWDVTFAFDPKLSVDTIEGPEVDSNPDDPDDVEAVTTWGGIPVVTNAVRRPSVSAFFEAWHSRTVVLNGLWIGSLAHEPCRVRMLTGSPDASRPSLATLVGDAHGAALPLGSIDFSGLSFSGDLAATTARVGHTSQLAALLDPATGWPRVGATGDAFRPDAVEDQLVADFLASSAARVAERPGGTRPIADFTESMTRSARLLERRDELVEGLSLGDTATLASQAQLAVDLLDGGICRAVTLRDFETWDTHGNNTPQHERFEALFAALGVLVEGLKERDLLDDTVVLVCSEMSRTPRLNAGGGKDHWSHTSAVLIGGNLDGSRVIGGTDDLLESLPVDFSTGAVDPAGALCRFDNLTAGLLELLDVDPGRWFPAVQPFRGLRE